MKLWKTLLCLAPAVLWPGVVTAQDAVKTDPKHYTVILDNPSVRVLKISYGQGEKSVMHQHPDAIVIPLVTSKVRFTTPDGKTTDQELAKDSAMYTPAGTHNPANVGTAKIEAILVEFKGAAPGTAALPASRPNMTLKTLAEGPRANAILTTADATFAEAAGTKHDFDQVVIALGPSSMSLSIDGKPAKTAWNRGDVQFVGRGVAHQAKNTGGKPVDMVIVAIK